METSKAEDAARTADQAGPSDAMDDDELVKLFLSEMREVDRDNEVNRILWAFKLNPYEKLNLRFDATPEDIRRQYRKLSAMVHPDKCKHPQASAAFDVVKQAQVDLLDDEKRDAIHKILDYARDELRKERKKQTKHDNLVKIASLLHEDGRDGVEAQWETTDEFHELWKTKSRDFFAKMEWRKRKLTKRIKDEEVRLEKDESETREKLKKQKQHHKDWEANREVRVGTWHDYMKQQGGKKATGVLKPPKLKTNDEDKLYVQRPVGEQFRQPPPKKPL